MESSFEYQEGGHQDDDRRPTTLHTEKIRGERKTFFLDLKENFRGRFVKITEDVKGRRDTILVPVEVLEEFAEAVESIKQFEKEN